MATEACAAPDIHAHQHGYNQNPREAWKQAPAPYYAHQHGYYQNARAHAYFQQPFYALPLKNMPYSPWRHRINRSPRPVTSTNTNSAGARERVCCIRARMSLCCTYTYIIYSYRRLKARCCGVMKYVSKRTVAKAVAIYLPPYNHRRIHKPRACRTHWPTDTFLLRRSFCKGATKKIKRLAASLARRVPGAPAKALDR